MDKIPVSEESVVHLDVIAPGVRGLRLVFVNLFAVESAGGGWVLVDAGIPLMTARVQDWVEEHVGKGARPSGILITHGHFDHVGTVKDLAEFWDVPVWAHPLELPYLTGQQQYPPPEPAVGGGLMALLSPMYPRDPINLGSRVRTLPEDGTVPGLPDWRWLHTPGHTQGHVSFFRAHDRCLIVGDAFCTTKQESFFAAVGTQKPELHGPPAYYTPDWDAARISVEKLAALEPEILAPGHGQPMAGREVAVKLRALARHFDEIARPDRGRYVEK